MSTKTHVYAAGAGKSLSVVVTGGQRNGRPVLREVIDDIRMPRVSGGRPRATPDVVLADRAYPTRATSEYLQARGIRTVTSEKVDPLTGPKKNGSSSGRPPGFDAEVYKGRNVVERAFNKAKQWWG